MAHLWQHPYVNVFKHFDVQTWKKASKEGEVTSVMDKSVKCTVYRILGSIPAANYIQLPKTQSQSLGLTGRYLYLLFHPVPGKYFVVHMDVATQDGLIVRVSFSNLFKEFKSTSTWLQFPFVCHAAKGSIHAHAGETAKDHSGPAPLSIRWTVLCLDLHYILSMYLNRRYSYLKSVKLCANMVLKNIFTSDTEYEPGLTFDEVKKTGLALRGIAPMPRDMAFPLGKSQKWHDVYDHIKFPTDTSKKPFDSIQYTKTGNAPQLAQASAAPGTISPRRVAAKTVHVTKNVKDRPSSTMQTATQKPKKPVKRHQVVRELPEVQFDGNVSVEQTDDGEIHVYAHPNEEILVHRQDRKTGRVSTEVVRAPAAIPAKKPEFKTLKPDPILKMRRIVGFGGSSYRDLLWTQNGTTVVYPCHAVVVAMQANNGHQRFFIGHTAKVSCISMNGNTTLLASGQTGHQSVVRVWRFQTAECLAMVKSHSHSLTYLSMSHSGNLLCGVGRDNHGKNMVVVWNTQRVSKGGEVTVMAKAHTDVDIQRMRVSTIDETRMVSCGRDNLRLWRMKEGQLRSAPVNLGEHHAVEFTDCCFETGYHGNKDPMDRLVYACSRSGHIFEIDYLKVAIHQVRRLLPTEPKTKKDKQTINSGAGIAINSMCVNEAFCVTGSDDGFLRLWPLDFKHVYLEAEHEGPVTAVDISAEGVKILAGTSTGNIGILDVSTRGYTTIMRSHTGRIRSASVDALRRHLVTVAEDHTIRIWDMDTMQQLYDFTAPKECPTCVSFHPSQQVFACGFESGTVRVFSVEATSMLAEHKQHRGKVIGVTFSPSGEQLYSAGSLGSLALYDSKDNGFPLLRLLSNMLARGEKRAPNALTVSPDGLFLAFVGPTEFTICVTDARSLDEVMRIDITALNAADNTRTMIDSALQVGYTPTKVGQLLVTTSSQKLLKFDAKGGRILTELDNIHRSGCTSFDVSQDGRHLLTSGDSIIKVWDYHMRLDLNFQISLKFVAKGPTDNKSALVQVFIGHCEPIARVMFSPDHLSVISIGESIFIWDFLAQPGNETRHMEGRAPVKNFYTNQEELPDPYDLNKEMKKAWITDSPGPRKSAPKPFSYQPKPITEISVHKEKMDPFNDIVEFQSDSDEEEVLIGPELNGKQAAQSDSDASDTIPHDTLGHGKQVQPHRRHGTPTKKPMAATAATAKTTNGQTEHQKPTVMKHFIQRPKTHPLAQRRYTAPPNQAGINLRSVIGYNGNGRGNMIWQPDTGLFAYTCGCIIVLENLNSGEQQHLTGHAEEVSTLALQHDCLVLASASGSFGLSASQICLWDLQTRTCKKVMTHHEHDIVALAFSRDDRFLVSIGDYRECSVVVWSAQTYALLTTATTNQPMHHVKWDPYTVNEFASVGQNGSVLFWLLDETGNDVSLNVHEAEVPEELLQTHHMGSGQVDFTCLEYAGDSTLYIATNSGKVSAWDTRHNSCFMHWEADTQEIDSLACRSGRLLTGSCGRNLRLWSVVGLPEMRLPGDNASMRHGGLTMDDEMNLDGAVTACQFDDTMDMGIVGTTAGTLWYVNWAERASIRLVSGHPTKVNALALYEDNYLASCSSDGSLRVWSVKDREQTLQFQVMDQSCNCLAFAPVNPPATTQTTVSNLDGPPVLAHRPAEEQQSLPNIAAGYSDGTVRMFDLNRVEMVLKMHPHAMAVTAICFSADSRMILSGSSDGLLAVSSPTTGMTVRVINDHKGAPITAIDVTFTQDLDLSISAPMLWLACSADRRVSIWSADWSKDFCELVDWLTFSAPSFTPEGTVIKKGDQSYYPLVPPSLARFSLEEPDMVVYTGYGMQKLVQFYSLSQRQVIRNISLTHWATAMDLCPKTPLIAIGANERLLKVLDYYEGSFQDFVGHNDTVELVKFSSDGKLLFSTSHSEILVWDVCL